MIATFIIFDRKSVISNVNEQTLDHLKDEKPHTHKRMKIVI